MPDASSQPRPNAPAAAPAASPGTSVPAPAPLRPRPALLLLVLMTGIGPFSLNIFLPSLPGLVGYFRTDPATVQLTLSLYLFGVAVGQLIYGPLSDRYGRRPLVLAGFALFSVTSSLCLVAPTIEVLIVVRIFQAIGSCAGMVLARAMIRDCWEREQSAAMIGTVQMAMTIAPMLAPVVGGYLDLWVGWRGGFVVIAAAGLALMVWLWWRLPETLAAPQPLPGLAGYIGLHLQLFRMPAFTGFTMIVGFTAGVFFAFLSGGPYFVVQGLGYAPTVYGYAFASVSVFYMLGNGAAARFSVRWGVMRMLGVGLSTTMAGCILILALTQLNPPAIYNLFAPMTLIAIGNGMAQPNAIAGGVSLRPQIAGTASGLMGFCQMGAGALASFIVGALETGNGRGTGLVIFACSVGTMLSLQWVRWLQRRHS